MSASTKGQIVNQPPSSGKPAAAANPELTELDALQMLLDLAGMIPGAGAVPDLLNATISVAKGDYIEAALSVVSAVPGVGDAAGAAKIAKNAEKYAQALVVVETKVLPKLPESVGKPLKAFIDKAKNKIDEIRGPKKDVPEPNKPKADTPKKEPEPVKGGKDTQIKERPKKRVKCFCVQDHAKGGRDEYERQLKRQQEGINSMSADDYLRERGAFTGKDPCTGQELPGGTSKKRNPKVTKNAKSTRLDQQARKYTKEFREKGMGPAKAEALGQAKAQRERGQQDALHNQDMVAGGQDRIGLGGKLGDDDFGLSDTNRHIGSQWNGERIQSIDEQACEMRKNGLGADNMNVELNPCGKHEATRARCKQKRR